MAETGKVIWLAGASGRVGSRVLEGLLQSPEFARVIAITRRPLGREYQRLANRIVPFTQLETQLRGHPCDAAMCCLTAPQLVVLDYARAALAAGARRFVMLSCCTADSASRRTAARIQGETLEALTPLGFESLDLLLPGPLLGMKRGAAPGEVLSMAIAALIRPLRFGAREAQRAVTCTDVATAMIGALRSGRRGVNRYDFSGIRSLSRMRGRT